MIGSQPCIGRWIGAVLLVALLAVASLSAGEATQIGPEALVDGFVRAWNSHDMRAFGNLFTEDADFVNVGGKWWKGRTEIQARHQETHAKGFSTSSLSSLGVSVRMLGADIAVIHFSWELTGQRDADGQQMPVRRGILQMVAVKQPDDWRIAASQNTNLREAAQQ